MSSYLPAFPREGFSPISANLMLPSPEESIESVELSCAPTWTLS